MVGILESIALFQTLIVGVIGFGGVITSILLNGKLARDQHARNVDHEASVLRRMLRAELLILEGGFKQRLDRLDEALKAPGRWPAVFVPKRVFTEAFDHSIAKLGLLTVSEVEPVLTAYGVAKEATDIVGTLADPQGTVPGHFVVREPRYEELKATCAAPLNAIRAALKEVTPKLVPTSSPPGLISGMRSPL